MCSLSNEREQLGFFSDKRDERPNAMNLINRTSLGNILPVADLEGITKDMTPGQKFIHFHAVFGKKWSNSRLTSSPALAPPLEHPDLATAFDLPSSFCAVIICPFHDKT